MTLISVLTTYRYSFVMISPMFDPIIDRCFTSSSLWLSLLCRYSRRFNSTTTLCTRWFSCWFGYIDSTTCWFCAWWSRTCRLCCSITRWCVIGGSIPCDICGFTGLSSLSCMWNINVVEYWISNYDVIIWR